MCQREIENNKKETVPRMEGPTDEQLIENLFDINFFNLLESTETDINNNPPVCWFYGEDEKWYLCGRCELCGGWTEFPSITHDCPFDNELSEFVNNLELIRSEVHDISDSAQQLPPPQDTLSDIEEVIGSPDEVVSDPIEEK